MSKLKGFIGETIVYGFANVFSKVFAMLLIPFYTAHLNGDGYSNLVMITSTFTILTILLALNSGVFYYFYEWKRKKYQKKIFATWFYYQLVCAVALGLFITFGAGWLKNYFIITPVNEAEIEMGLMLLPLLFIPYIVNITNVNFYRIERRAKSAVSIVFLEALFTFAIVVPGLQFYDFHIPEVILGMIAARTIVALLFLKTARYYLHWTGFSFKILKRLLRFSWPYFIISLFSWVTLSIDKFIGVGSLSDNSDIAILALSMQLCLPIVVVADMIRTAIGPFIMSIKDDTNASHTYQQVFDLSVFTALAVLVSIIIATPYLTYLLGNETYVKSILVIPLIGFASVLGMVYNQFSISFNLAKKNTYILVPTIIGGLVVVACNTLFMKEFGFIISGVSQVAGGLIMVTILFLIGKKITELSIRLFNSFVLTSITAAFVTLVYVDMNEILSGNYFSLFFGGGLCLMLMTLTYFLTVKRFKA